jgi:hypothetical protein
MGVRSVPSNTALLRTGLRPAAERDNVRRQVVANPTESLRPGALALFAAWMLFMGGREPLQRLWIAVDGTVVSAETTTSNRTVTRYVLRTRDGQQMEYVAGPTDYSLPRRLPVGTVLHKERWRLSFVRDGREVNTFPILFYVVLVLGGLGLEVFAYRLWKLKKSGQQMGAV